MDSIFWQQKWEKNEIGFHKNEANPVLVNHFKSLALAPGDRVFVPLCGKTLDIAWLLEQGYRVAGAELVEMAIEQLFAELGLTPTQSETPSDIGPVKHYSAPNIDIFVGNIFDVSQPILGPVDAIYDRAALVALPKAVRDRYTTHLTEMTGTAPQLLVTFEYDQTIMAGPPFSICHAEVTQQYGHAYAVTLVQSTTIPGGLKGKCEAKETVWRLERRQ